MTRIVKMVAAGGTADSIIEEFPQLAEADVQEALLYAAAAVAERTSPAPHGMKFLVDECLSPTIAALLVEAGHEHTIHPEVERFMAKRMNATTIEVDAGHLSLVSHPEIIADLIRQAANN